MDNNGMTNPPGRATPKPPPLPPVTDKQADVLVVIHDAIVSDPLDRSPTIKRIAIKLGIGKTTVFQHIERLQIHKCVECENPGQVHGLTMTATGNRVVSAWKGKHDTDTTRTG